MGGVKVLQLHKRVDNQQSKYHQENQFKLFVYLVTRFVPLIKFCHSLNRKKYIRIGTEH